MSDEKCECGRCQAERGELPWQIEARRQQAAQIVIYCTLILIGLLLGLIAGQI